MSATGEDQPVHALFASAIAQATTLMRQTAELARAELGESVTRAVNGVPLMGVAIALMVGATVMTLLALARIGARLFDIPEDWSLIGLSAVAALVAWLLMRAAIRRLSAASLVPTRAAEQFARDLHLAKDQMR